MCEFSQEVVTTPHLWPYLPTYPTFLYFSFMMRRLHWLIHKTSESKRKASLHSDKKLNGIEYICLCALTYLKQSFKNKTFVRVVMVMTFPEGLGVVALFDIAIRLFKVSG